MLKKIKIALQRLKDALLDCFTQSIEEVFQAIGSLIFAGFFLQIGMYLAERLFW